ncbi:xylulokinase [Streptococcus plurextorum]|uniref:xylulokinase n=1 Tax=Streptococcus plurextorum TaxID=456876 RepID=UPI000417EC99|nr:FGGY-family carbohydrate kinase [Streptococcus plurextorum]
MEKIIDDLSSGRTSLGIELGSTRIKAVLIDSRQQPIATGNYEWENQFLDGIWTYSLEAIWLGLQTAYHNLVKNVEERYRFSLTRIGQIGISAMMHGYMAFDDQHCLLVPFRTWRNSTASQAASELSQLFNFNIPERWSIAHLYQAILDKEDHVARINYLTTLAGYVHWQLTGQKVLGVGDASGMFPIDSQTGDYRLDFLETFSRKIADRQLGWTLQQLLPKVMTAGKVAGILTEEGAKLLDPSGQLVSGARMCPPEGDAGTGMVATNSIARRRGNISAGTSIFAMVVLEQDLKHYYPEIDIVTTPVGHPVAMVHANNCSSDINAWVTLFKEFSELTDNPVTSQELYSLLFQEAMSGDKDCGGLLAYGYYSGESITHLTEGCPLFVRRPDSQFTLSNFMRSLLLSAFSTLTIGMEKLIGAEHIQIDRILGHGGIFKTPGVAQGLLAAALSTPIATMETAGEGGAWGIALLADYLNDEERSLEAYLDQLVFSEVTHHTIHPNPADEEGFQTYLERYQKGLVIERAAVNALRR